MLSVIMLSVIMLCVLMLNVTMLSVIMPSVVVPSHQVYHVPFDVEKAIIFKLISHKDLDNHSREIIFLKVLNSYFTNYLKLLFLELVVKFEIKGIVGKLNFCGCKHIHYGVSKLLFNLLCYQLQFKHLVVLKVVAGSSIGNCSNFIQLGFH